MMDEIRYQLACARLHSLADVGTWTPQELLDVFLLTKPPVPFATWQARAQEAGTAQPPVLPTTGAAGDAVSDVFLGSIIDGKAAAELEKIGCLKVEVA